eukprot:scaffold24003_cov39-Prasinocladus_malaysianus.AAC.1
MGMQAGRHYGTLALMVAALLERTIRKEDPHRCANECRLKSFRNHVLIASGDTGGQQQISPLVPQAY